MAITVGDIVTKIETIAPPDTAQEWDSVGLQVGRPDAVVGTVLVSLEITDRVVREAEELGADLIVSHHPFIFDPLSAVRTDRPVGALLVRLLQHQIAVYAAHTNLDAAPRVGTAHVLAELLEIDCDGPLLEDGEVGLGCVGNVQGGMALDEFVALIEERLHPARLAVVHGADRPIERVALMPGSGGDAVSAAVSAGADVLVCGDLKHHDALDALSMGLMVIDATHYATERPVVDRLADYLDSAFAGAVEVKISEIVTDPFADSSR